MTGHSPALPSPSTEMNVTPMLDVLLVLRINREPVAPEALAARLRGVYAGRREKVIQIAGYPGVRYEQIVNAMDVARGAGVTVVAVAPRDAYLRR